MRAAILKEPKGRLQIEERAVPTPVDGEVLVRVHACGVCHGDLMVRNNSITMSAPSPSRLWCQIGGDPPRPSCEASVWSKLLARSVDAPKRFNSQILRDAWVTHDANNPCVNLALELSNQRLESIDLAKRKSLEQIHVLLYCLLRNRSEWVTSFSNTRGAFSEMTKGQRLAPGGQSSLAKGPP